MAFWVYLLRCADDSYYTGHTDNLEQRIGEHQSGVCSGYTASRLPVSLLWSQECATREEALSAEMQIKGWSRKKKEAMMRGDWAGVALLAKKTLKKQPINLLKIDISIRPFSLRYGAMRLLRANGH
ncbi:MAG: GIY-YIG nuclease family protein [Gallionellaceae bacterium]|nr:GIY-YIG nuclease family protein [Gallionellaceae bacterium]